MTFRILLIIVSIFIALFFYGKSVEGKRKLAKIWLLGSAAWLLPCVTVLLYPYPAPEENVTDVVQWQAFTFFFELFLRLGSLVFCLLLALVYYLSPLKDR